MANFDHCILIVTIITHRETFTTEKYLKTIILPDFVEIDF